MSTALIRSWLTRPLSNRGAWIGFGVAAVVAAIVILRQYRGLTFFYDEWNFIQDRRGWGPGSFLAAHNEHFVAFPVFLFKAWFALFGLGSYWPYAVLAVLCHLLCVGMLFVLVRSWSNNELALGSAIALMFLGSAFEVLMWPFEIEISLCLALGLGALLLLQRQSRRSDIWACVLLILAISSSTLAIPLIVAALVLILMQRFDWRRLLVVVVPIALYGAWYLKYGDSTAQLGNARYIPEYSAKQAAATLHALLGLPPEFGSALAVAALVVVIVALVKRWGTRTHLVPVLVALVVMWTFLALSRYGIAPPDSSRYLYPSAILMVLAAAAIIGRQAITSITGRLVIVVALLMSLPTNISELAKGAAGWRGGSEEVRASLGALTEVRPLVPGSFNPQGHWAPQIQAGKFFAAADQYGSTAFEPAEITSASDAARAGADTVLLTAGALSVQPGSPEVGGIPPSINSVADGTSSPGGVGCVRLSASPGKAAVAILPVPTTGLVVTALRADAPIRVARYSVLGPGEPVATATPGGASQVVRPTIALGPPPWRVQVATGGVATLCRVK